MTLETRVASSKSFVRHFLLAVLTTLSCLQAHDGSATLAVYRALGAYRSACRRDEAGALRRER